VNKLVFYDKGARGGFYCLLKIAGWSKINLGCGLCLKTWPVEIIDLISDLSVSKSVMRDILVHIRVVQNQPDFKISAENR
jgi:hypothetical protein